MKIREESIARRCAVFSEQLDLFTKPVPFEQYAILVPLELINTTAVVYPSTNGSIEIFEIFIPTEIVQWEFLAHGDPVVADEILCRCLGSCFSFSSGEALWINSLDPTFQGVLVAFKASDKANPKDLRDIVRDIIEVPSSEFVNLLFRILSYERLIIKTMIENRLPCFLTNQSGRIITANCSFKDLLDIPTLEPMTELNQIISFGEQNDLLKDVKDEQWTAITPIYCRNTGRVFESRVSISPLLTPIGRRFLWTLSDIPFNQIQAGSNAILLERLTAVAATAEEPETALRSIINIVVASFQADIVAIFKECDGKRLVITPYSNRKSESIELNVLECRSQPELEPYFERRQPLFYPDMSSLAGPSVVKFKLDAQQFALVPVTSGNKRYALLVIWQNRIPGIDSRILTTLKTIANIIATTLSTISIKTEAEKERQRIQRYARLTAGREIQMTRLKRQIKELEALLAKFTGDRKQEA